MESSVTSIAGESVSPICLLVVGMAGSGKTTLVKKLAQAWKTNVINLDPACKELSYDAFIDIRDTVNYKEVMKQYNLGPNGGIVTSLNLFCTKFGKVVELIEHAGKSGRKICVLDTPGQIEVFTWSASGAIITEALAAAFPTIIVYVMDVSRSKNPTTFMSNMLYACSILYKTRLPFIVTLNKIDIEDHGFALEWMTEFDTFHAALETERTFVSNLTRSMSLTLDEFYRELKTCGVSAKTGIGLAKFYEVVNESVKEYEKGYKKEYAAIRAEGDAIKLKKKVDQHLSSSNDDSIPTLAAFIPEVPSGRELSDIYLKHPCNESSDDEQGDEEHPVAFASEEMDENYFNDIFQKKKRESKSFHKETK